MAYFLELSLSPLTPAKLSSLMTAKKKKKSPVKLIILPLKTGGAGFWCFVGPFHRFERNEKEAHSPCPPERALNSLQQSILTFSNDQPQTPALAPPTSSHWSEIWTALWLHYQQPGGEMCASIWQLWQIIYYINDLCMNDSQLRI